MRRWMFTSESVAEGHPDKMCDQISDGILDAILEKDPMARVACDVTACNGFALIYGQITTKAEVDIPETARGVIRPVRSRSIRPASSSPRSRREAEATAHTPTMSWSIHPASHTTSAPVLVPAGRPCRMRIAGSLARLTSASRVAWSG